MLTERHRSYRDELFKYLYFQYLYLSKEQPVRCFVIWKNYILLLLNSEKYRIILNLEKIQSSEFEKTWNMLATKFQV